MHYITLICTVHYESGKCSVSELQNIIESIGPQVIFEELSYLHFNESYLQKKLITLETSAIKEYLKNHNVVHIPVDTYTLPKDYHFDLDRMYDKIFTSNMIKESHVIRSLMDNHAAMINQEGFGFLNSEIHDKYMEEISILKEKILNVLDNKDLFRIQRLEKETIEKREYEIISNIYSFSSKNSYENAVMFIGSGHRKSIFEMINKFEIREKTKLNWIGYNSAGN